ncbi:MAG: hypothetical protein L0K86_23195, partial [Actinomycetia bacterium]|nr:hypothetical protein [Actinomycetes bacterium]
MPDDLLEPRRRWSALWQIDLSDVEHAGVDERDQLSAQVSGQLVADTSEVVGHRVALCTRRRGVSGDRVDPLDGLLDLLATA